MAGLVQSLLAGGHPLTTKVHHGRRTLSVVPHGKERRWPTLVRGIILLDQGASPIHADPQQHSGHGCAREAGCSLHPWKTKVLAKPPVGSDLKPVLGDSGLPILGHTIEFFREGPDFALNMYRKHGPLCFSDPPIMRSVVVSGPDAIQAVFANKNKDFFQEFWNDVIGPFFNRGLMLLNFDEHLYHRRT